MPSSPTWPLILTLNYQKYKCWIRIVYFVLFQLGVSSLECATSDDKVGNRPGLHLILFVKEFESSQNFASIIVYLNLNRQKLLWGTSKKTLCMCCITIAIKTTSKAITSAVHYRKSNICLSWNPNSHSGLTLMLMIMKKMHRYVLHNYSHNYIISALKEVKKFPMDMLGPELRRLWSRRNSAHVLITIANVL